MSTAIEQAYATRFTPARESKETSKKELQKLRDNKARMMQYKRSNRK